VKFIPANRLKVLPANIIGVLAFLIASTLTLLLAKPAFATSPFAEATIVHARMQTSVVASATNYIMVLADTTSGEAGGQTTVHVIFDGGYTVNATASNITVSTACLPANYHIAGGVSTTAVVNWPGIGSAASAVAGQDITFSSTALSASTLYGFCITGGVTNPTAASTNRVNTITANGDSTQVATNFISNDQVSVTAIVPPTFSMTLSANTDNFTGNLSTSAVTATSGITATFVTNASKGWVLQEKSANQGLKSATASNHTITSANSGSITTLANGTEGYGTAVTSKVDSGTAGSGTVHVDAKFDDTGGAGNKVGDLNQATYQPLAYADGPTDTDSITFKERATISGLTPAATDYTDTLTIVGAANF
jgi:hypothetical protein